MLKIILKQLKVIGVLPVLFFLACNSATDPGKVATPAAKPGQGTYTAVQSVTLSCDTEGAAIYYTIDKTTPTSSSTLYASPISIAKTTTLKAIAIKSGMDDSDVMTAVYTIGPPGKVATPAASPDSGIYELAQNVTLSCDTEGAAIYYTIDGKTPTSSSTLYASPITIDQKITLKAIAIKSGMDDSDVMTAVYTIGKIIATPAASPDSGIYELAQNVTLSCDTEGAAIYYTIDGKTPTSSSTLYASPITIDQKITLKAIAVKSGMNNSDVMTAVYTIGPPGKVATPAASPDPGIYELAQEVTLSCDTEGAEIYYTIDGKTPTSSSSPYTDPINIDQRITIKAIAVKSGMTNSDVMTAKYTIGKIIDLHTKWPFMTGAAAPSEAFNTSNGQYALLKHFNVLVAENEMKPQSIMPASKPTTLPGTYNWTNADKLVDYAKANNTEVRGHVLVWHNQTTPWFFNGSGKDGRATKDELYERMESHIKTVFEKYKGDVLWWDVCNEVVGDDGAIRPASSSKYTAIMEDSGLTGIDRYEFVLKAFEWARQYANENEGTDVKLYLTDYSIETSGAKQNEFARLIDYLIANNAPIDGVGFQCHIQYSWPEVSQISSAIEKFAAKQRSDGKKLMTQVTELDMSLFAYDDKSKTLSDSVRNTRLTTQATRYRQLFDMFKQKYEAGKLDMVLVWGIDDGHSWLNNWQVDGLRTDYPLLFDRNYAPKDAYWELVK